MTDKNLKHAIQFLTLHKKNTKTKMNNMDSLYYAQLITGDMNEEDSTVLTNKALRKSKLLIARAIVKANATEKNKLMNLLGGNNYKQILNKNNLPVKVTAQPTPVKAPAPDTEWNPPIPGLLNKKPTNDPVKNTRFKNFMTRVPVEAANRRNSKFLNATRYVVENGKGSVGTYGRVVSLKLPPARFFSFRNRRPRYALKEMVLGTRTSSLKSFLREVSIGSLKGIEKVGPRIYAWKLVRNSFGRATAGMYIMDSFDSMAPAGCTITTLYNYIKKIKPPLTNSHPLISKVREALVKFWKITKGYHGDLPTNIGVVHSITHPDEVKKVIVFDYASHKKFKSSTVPNSFKNFVELINKEGQMKLNEYGGNPLTMQQQPGVSATPKPLKNNSKVSIFMGVPLIDPEHRQSYRFNTNTLRTMHRILPGVGNNKRTLMNMLMHEPKKRTWRNTLRNMAEYTHG